MAAFFTFLTSILSILSGLTWFSDWLGTFVGSGGVA
jgi:heme/copper-type cytochrome/quinol oxidase subunit 1